MCTQKYAIAAKLTWVGYIILKLVKQINPLFNMSTKLDIPPEVNNKGVNVLDQLGLVFFMVPKSKHGLSQPKIRIQHNNVAAFNFNIYNYLSCLLIITLMPHH